MKKNGTEIYALAVCFLAMAAIAVTTVFAIFNALGIAAPAFTVDPWQVDSYETNEAYTRYWPKEKPIPAEAVLTVMREAEFGRVLDRERRSSVRRLTLSCIILLIASVMFVTHWRLHERARSTGVA